MTDDTALDYDAATIQQVTINGDGPRSPNEITTTVEYPTHRNQNTVHVTDIQHTVTPSGIAKLDTVSGDGRYVDQLNALAVVEESILDVRGVNEVVTVRDEYSNAVRFIQACRSNVTEP